MIYIPDRPHISPTQACAILTQHTQSFGIFIDIDRVSDYLIHYTQKVNKDLDLFHQIVGSPDVKMRDGDTIARALVQRFGFKSKWFHNKDSKKGALTVRKDARLELLNNAEYYELTEDQVKVLEFIHELLTAEFAKSSFKQYLDGTPVTQALSFEGHKMALVRPQWDVLATHRLQAVAPSFQNIDKRHLDIITYPEGYIMVHADSGQIEPRIMYSHYIKDELLKQLIMKYGDAYFGQLHYVTMGGDEFDYFMKHPEQVQTKELDKGLRSELKLLGLAGAYGSINLDKFNRQLAEAYTNRIVNHPKRVEWQKQVDQEVRNGRETFHAVFGAEVIPEEKEKYQRGTQGWHNHLVRCGINNPIQSTAAELMAESVYQADKILREEAVGRSKIAAYIHDAGLFYLQDCDAHLAEKLQGCLSYQVRDWIPIESEGGIGKKKGDSNVPEY